MTTRNSDHWVLVPGTLCTHDVFTPLLECLGVTPGQSRFITADSPHVEDYDTALRRAVTGGEIVCGFSLGALVLAHNLGALERAKAVVLLACNPFADAKSNRANREAVRDRVLAGDARGCVRENWGAMSADPNPDLRNQVAAMAEATKHLAVAQTELAASRPGAEAELSATALPLVFVTGSEDKLTPPDPIRQLSKEAIQAQLEVLDGLGHFALLEAPARVAQAILHGLDIVLAETNNESRNL